MNDRTNDEALDVELVGRHFLTPSTRAQLWPTRLTRLACGAIFAVRRARGDVSAKWRRATGGRGCGARLLCVLRWRTC